MEGSLCTIFCLTKQCTISAGHTASNRPRGWWVPTVVCSIDGEAECEGDGTVLMSVKIASELGTRASSIKKKVLVTELNGWSWTRSCQQAVHPLLDSHFPCGCDVVVWLLKDTQSLVFSDLDQPNKQAEVTANGRLWCDLGKTCVCKRLVPPARWEPCQHVIQ